ncbi:MAG: HlyD family type I secretion periplasmic adaptor subunit [Hyphomicrobiales bacterium]|nr:HlyD family type I secretion periplasmic adaptor subunit [Hyphomicrobiales bacterium]
MAKSSVSRSPAQKSMRRHMLYGFALVGLVAGGVGGWAATSDISGAVIAPGMLVVDSNVKKVQHPTGGVVGEIRVRDGNVVKAGDILVRLDGTVLQANLAIVTKRLLELWARRARLEAERDGAASAPVPVELKDRLKEPAVAAVIAAERRLFDLRARSRAGQKSQLGERIKQAHEEIAGLDAQAKAKAREVVLIKRELEGTRKLWAKNLVPISKLTALEREATRVEGERAALVSSIARAKGRISEVELQIIQIDKDLSSEVAKELAQINANIGEFVERQVAAVDQLKRIDIRAPQNGVIHQSTVHTVGRVIKPGEDIMVVIPRGDSLTVETRIAPQDIDQVRIGQEASLRFTSFNQRTTPEIFGAVKSISADVTKEERSGASYYTVRIEMPAKEVARLGAVRLVPGMPVEAFIKTADRKVLTYLLKPLSDQIQRAFRER